MELYPSLPHIYIYCNICNILLILSTHLFTILKLMFYPFMYPQFLKYCESGIHINWMSELGAHSLCLRSSQPLVSALPSLSLTQVWHLLLFNCLVMSSSPRPHGLQHTRLPCLLPSPKACSNSCPLSHWSRPTISASVVPFPCPQSFRSDIRNQNLAIAKLFKSCQDIVC